MEGGENSAEALQASGRSEPLMDLLSPSQRSVAVLSPVVQAFVGEMLHRRHQLAEGGAVASQLVGDDPLFAR